MQIKEIDVDKLIPYAKNSRTHSDAQVAQIAASIKEFGFRNPILVDGYSLIAGHGRLLASRKLGLTKVPTIDCSDMTATQKKAYIIADNQLALNSGWDTSLLSLELEELQLEGFDLDLLGFDPKELNTLLEPEVVDGLTDEDAIPKVPDEPKTKLGDIYILGNHRLMCGDSTSIDAVEKLMDGQKADVLFTDPPYGINFAPQRGTHEKILNDSLEDKEFNDFLDSTFGCALSNMKPDTYVFVWTGWSRIGSFETSIKKFFKIQALHIWVKNNFGIGYYSRPKHEPFYLCLNGKPIYPNKAPADVWEANKVHKTIHSCEKPVELIINILDIYHKNSLVLDLFGGSGSTMIACEKTKRNARLMELDPKYCDVIVKRWEEFTGKTAVLSEL